MIEESDLFKITQKLEEIKEICEKVVNQIFSINYSKSKINKILGRYQDGIDFEKRPKKVKCSCCSDENNVEF